MKLVYPVTVGAWEPAQVFLVLNQPHGKTAQFYGTSHVFCAGHILQVFKMSSRGLLLNSIKCLAESHSVHNHDCNESMGPSNSKPVLSLTCT